MASKPPSRTLALLLAASRLIASLKACFGLGFHSLTPSRGPDRRRLPSPTFATTLRLEIQVAYLSRTRAVRGGKFEA